MTELAPERKGELSFAQARTFVKDLFEHKAWIYWMDFLLSLSLAYGAVALYLTDAFHFADRSIVHGFAYVRRCFFQKTRDFLKRDGLKHRLPLNLKERSESGEEIREFGVEGHDV